MTRMSRKEELTEVINQQDCKCPGDVSYIQPMRMIEIKDWYRR